MLNHAGNPVFARQVASIMLMAAGWGFIAGNFGQPFTPFLIGGLMNLVHFVPLVALIVLSLRVLSPTEAAGAPGSGSTGAVRGITGLAIYGLIGCLVMTALGLSNPDPNSVGVHSALDWIAALIFESGAVLWLSTVVARRHASVPARMTGSR